MKEQFRSMTKDVLVKYIREHPTESLDLSRANLSDANLSWANLSDANLSWADLSRANLSDANLSWANLSRANLSDANLSWANLSDANLSDFRFIADGIDENTVKHLMAYDFRTLGKNAKQIVENAIKTHTCPFDNEFPPQFMVLAGAYWQKGLQGYFTTTKSMREVWQMVVHDLNKSRGEQKK